MKCLLNNAPLLPLLNITPHARALTIIEQFVVFKSSKLLRVSLHEHTPQFGSNHETG